MAVFEAAGYVCTRSGANLGVFDIIAIGPADVQLCQVKTARWPDAVEMEAIKVFRCPPNCVKVVHRWRDRQKTPDVKVVSNLSA